MSVEGGASTSRPQSLINNPWLDGWYEGVLRGRRKSDAAGVSSTVDRKVAVSTPAAVAVARPGGASKDEAAIGGIQSGTAQIQAG